MSRRLALVLVGDVMLGRIVDESLTALPRQLHGGVWGDVLPLLKGGMVAGVGEEQLVAGNLVCRDCRGSKGGWQRGLAGWLSLMVAPDSPHPGCAGTESCQHRGSPGWLPGSGSAAAQQAQHTALCGTGGDGLQLQAAPAQYARPQASAAGRCGWQLPASPFQCLPAADPAYHPATAHLQTSFFPSSSTAGCAHSSPAQSRPF
jgi:hypothetical protein